MSLDGKVFAAVVVEVDVRFTALVKLEDRVPIKRPSVVGTAFGQRDSTVVGIVEADRRGKALHLEGSGHTHPPLVTIAIGVLGNEDGGVRSCPFRLAKAGIGIDDIAFDCSNTLIFCHFIRVKEVRFDNGRGKRPEVLRGVGRVFWDKMHAHVVAPKAVDAEAERVSGVEVARAEQRYGTELPESKPCIEPLVLCFEVAHHERRVFVF